MKVNFNNLRRQTLYTYERLVKKLNDGIDENGTVSVEAEEIKEDMDSLRSLLGSIACTYDEENEEFKDIYEEVYPEPKTMTLFNDTDE